MRAAALKVSTGVDALDDVAAEAAENEMALGCGDGSRAGIHLERADAHGLVVVNRKRDGPVRRGGRLNGVTDQRRAVLLIEDELFVGFGLHRKVLEGEVASSEGGDGGLDLLSRQRDVVENGDEAVVTRSDLAPRERQTAVIDGAVIRDVEDLRVPGLQFAGPDDDLLVVGIIFRRVDVFDAEAFVKNERAAFHVPAGVGFKPERFGEGDLAFILFNVALKVQGFDSERSGEKLQLIIAVVVVAGLRNGQIVKGIVALENRERAFGSTVIEMGFADHQVLETVEGAAVELKIREDQNLIVDGIGAASSPLREASTLELKSVKASVAPSAT